MQSTFYPNFDRFEHVLTVFDSKTRGILETYSLWMLQFVVVVAQRCETQLCSTTGTRTRYQCQTPTTKLWRVLVKFLKTRERSLS